MPRRLFRSHRRSQRSNSLVLTASALVLFMTLPGLTLFYGGLVRTANLPAVLMRRFVISCVVSLVWMAIGSAPGGSRANSTGSLDWRAPA